jgi:hypothetical protein
MVSSVSNRVSSMLNRIERTKKTIDKEEDIIIGNEDGSKKIKKENKIIKSYVKPVKKIKAKPCANAKKCVKKIEIKENINKKCNEHSTREKYYMKNVKITINVCSMAILFKCLNEFLNKMLYPKNKIGIKKSNSNDSIDTLNDNIWEGEVTPDKSLSSEEESRIRLESFETLSSEGVSEKIMYQVSR